MELTSEFLRHISLPQSYERGENYYEDGLVSRLTKRGNEYTAEVWGSVRYKVWISLEGANLQSTCSCPYDYSGPCKHIVAVGVAILQEDYDEVIDPIEVVSEEEGISLNEFFEKHYFPAHQTQKDAFLLQLIKKNGALREQFIQFIQKDELIIRENIGELSKEVNKIVKSDDYLTELAGGIDNDLFGDERTGPEEDFEVVLAEIIDEYFSSYHKKIKRYLKIGRVDEALRVILGMYEGMNLADTKEIYSEEIDSTHQEVIKGYLTDLGTYISSAVIDVKTGVRMIYLIFERWDKYEQVPNSLKHPSFKYYLPLFIPLWKELVSDEVTAQALKTRLEAYGVYNLDFSELYLHIAYYQQDKGLESKILKDFAGEHLEFGKKLGHEYLSKGQLKEAKSLLEKLVVEWPLEIASEFKHLISYKDFPTLFKEMYQQLAGSEMSMEHFLTLKKYLAKEETDTFIASQKQKVGYYIQLLASEERYGEIVEFIRLEEYRLWTKDLEIALKPVLNIFPEFCLELLKERVRKKEKERTRDAYKEMCKLLVLMRKIESRQSETDSFIQLLYDLKLPALNEEMRRGRIV